MPQLNMPGPPISTSRARPASRTRRSKPFARGGGRNSAATTSALSTILSPSFWPAKKVSPATYGRAEAALGRDGIIEAVTCAGFYGMVGSVLNTFEVPPQPGGDVLT